jgi:apolipoprotein N-acyltransferase
MFSSKKIIAIQGNIAQEKLLNSDNFSAIFWYYYRIIEKIIQERKTQDASPAIIVMPESAVPYYDNSNRTALIELLQKLLPENYAIIFSSTYLNENDNPYNILTAIDKQKSATKSKYHLVPFGEYLPMRSWFPKFMAVASGGMQDFIKGNNAIEKISIGEFNIVPLICYEVIFNDQITNIQPIDAIVNVVNDGWISGSLSVGHYQHYTMAKIRAVKANSALIRVSNNGITAVLDKMGREVIKMPQWQSDIAVVNLPV